MKKIEFLNELVKHVWGPETKVTSTDCGQRYDIHVRYNIGTMYVDSLKGGRCSIKIKYPSGYRIAQRISDSMKDFLLTSPNLTVDAATKAKAYIGHNSQLGYYYVANLRCDRYWEE